MKKETDKQSGHMVTLKYRESKLVILNDPASGAFTAQETNGDVAAARGMLAMAEKALLITPREAPGMDGKLIANFGDLDIQCDDGHVVALGLVIMARDFWTLAFSIECQINMAQQAQPRVAQPNPGQSRFFTGRA